MANPSSLPVRKKSSVKIASNVFLFPAFRRDQQLVESSRVRPVWSPRLKVISAFFVAVKEPINIGDRK